MEIRSINNVTKPASVASKLAGLVNSPLLAGVMQEFMYKPTIHAHGLSGPRSFIQMLTKPGPFQYAIHLERLDGVVIKAFDYVPMADCFTVIAEFLGDVFQIESDWEGELLLVAGLEMPKEKFEILSKHMDNITRTSLIENIKARTRFKNINKTA